MADDSEIGRVGPRARICIDFGTALSKASLCLDPTLPLEIGVRPIPLGLVTEADHPLLTPSVMFVDGGRLFFGPPAFEYARRNVAGNRDPLLSFKTVLGAKDVAKALATQLPPSYDPTGTFRQRDALVLYLAYLDQVLSEALRRMPDLPSDVSGVRRRYTSPVWTAGGSVDRVFEQIFNEAAAVSARLSRLLLSPEGISIAQCRDALEKAAAQPGDGKLDSGVFEPHAAAAAALAYTNSPTRFVCVFDMGAGTNDIAAFDFNETVEPPTLSEIKEARQCTPLAGDEIDRILVDLIMRKRNAPDEDRRVYRATRLHARELKKELFASGRIGLKEGWRTTSLRLQELMEDQTFRQFLAALHQSMGLSLGAVADRARAAGVNEIDIVLAGGGANLPFMVDVVRLAGAQAAPGMRLRIGPLTPANALYGSIDQYFVAVFPQIAMSVGGALVELMPERAAA
ncbi:MAG: Hsp70 family protein [Hyphomonadaceae bacterium]|nr:Hsp70 family protein [Hyphomonadaceae bacterium]MBX3511335.1 Hsp70 family protein [Hyphomonadaceae bacterium]